MRIPAACNDRTLLEDEPFLTSFMEASRKAKYIVEQLDMTATKELKLAPGGVRIFSRSVLERWMLHVECLPFRLKRP